VQHEIETRADTVFRCDGARRMCEDAGRAGCHGAAGTGQTLRGIPVRRCGLPAMGNAADSDVAE